ncbi:MAG: DUF4428 domain-containing protein [Acutalibacteraceae bacterium]
MGLFDKKFCDICGGKVNTLTQKKLADGFLCSDCKHKLGSFTSGWKQRSVEDAKKHLQQREENKAKYQQFVCSATAGGQYNSIQVDFNKRQFIFAINNNDYKSGNPQVFDFSQLQDFWLEQEFRSLSDSDNDGIPDRMDNYDNRQGGQNNGFMGMMNNQMNAMNMSMVNVPLSAQPFIRNSSSSFSSTSIKEVSDINACFRVTDPYITTPISFSVTGSITSGNQMELMNAYEIGVQIMQLCQQIKQGGAAPMNGGYAQPNAYGQPNAYAQQNMYGQQNTYAPQGAYAQPGAYQQQNAYPQQNAYGAAPVGGYAPQQSQYAASQQRTVRCDKCGWMPESGAPVPKFCPQCGDPFDQNDMI